MPKVQLPKHKFYIFVLPAKAYVLEKPLSGVQARKAHRYPRQRPERPQRFQRGIPHISPKKKLYKPFALLV